MSPNISVLVEPKEKIKKPVETADVTVNNGESPKDKTNINDATAATPYQQKKWMAQGMLDLALLSANSNQLRYILDSDNHNHYFYISLTVISLSLVLQFLVAIALVTKMTGDGQESSKYTRLNYFIMIGVLLITISNGISTAFTPVTSHQQSR